MFNIGAGRHFWKQTKALLAELLTAGLKTGGESAFTAAMELNVLLFSPQVLIKSSVGVPSSPWPCVLGLMIFL